MMASKAWKLSASVIIALRTDFARVGKPKLSDSFISGTKEDLNGIERNELQILSLRRSKSDKYLPGAHVFPGGNIDPADTNPEWLDVFQSFGFDQNSFKTLSDSKNVDIPQFCQSFTDSRSSTLPGWLALRLCAIREAFEECGILLCRSPSGEKFETPWGSYVTVHEMDSWQRRVRRDPSQMMALCRSEGCVPDVWSLHLWSNWLTPPQQQNRYNAIFFMVVLRTKPPHSLDDFEMDELKWSAPLDLVEGAISGKYRLINPQFYEASRLSVINNADTLAAFAATRAQHGCPCWMPVQERAQDGMLFLLPGDSAYPEEISYEDSQKPVSRPETLAELSDKVRKRGGILHRMELLKSQTCPRIVVDNFIPTHNHVLPLSTTTDSSQSKL